MAVVGTEILNKFIGNTEAEKAFEPWWDTTEDFLVYGLIMLGLVAFPTTMFSNTPLDCTVCDKQDGNCDFMEGKDNFHPIDGSNVPDPGHNAWWVKKYCTMTEVNYFTLYFPYLLLLIPILMIAIEKGFITIFKANMKLETFYNLLVKEITESGGVTASETPGEGSLFIENRKDVLELSQKFRGKTNFFLSYVFRTILEIVLAIALLAYLCIVGLPTVLDNIHMHCDVYGISYECAGHPIKFYLCLVIIAILFLSIYGICGFCALVWLCGGCNTMQKIMSEFKRKYGPEGEGSAAAEGSIDNYYYKNTDLRLLLNLLAETHGSSTSLRVLALFDPEFNKELKIPTIDLGKKVNGKTAPPEIRQRQSAQAQNMIVDETGEFEEEKVEVYNLDVYFDDAPALTKGVLQVMRDRKEDTSFMYTIELSPPTKKSSVISCELPSKDDIANVERKKANDKLKEAEMEGTEMEEGLKSEGKKEEPKWRGILEDLEIKKEYTIRVNTVVNGKTLASKVSHIPAMKSKNE